MIQCTSRSRAATGIVTFALARLDLWRLSFMMTKISYTGYRFPPVIIQRAIWLYDARLGEADAVAQDGLVVEYFEAGHARPTAESRVRTMKADSRPPPIRSRSAGANRRCR